MVPMSTQISNLTHHFLIAMPGMQDPHFQNALTFIAEHGENGALGLIVNRPMDMRLAELFERVDIELTNEVFAEKPVYFGGPVQTERGFVLHRPAMSWHSSLKMDDYDMGLTSSKDILESIAQTGQPNEVIVALGYAGWEAGQLEAELMQNAWLPVPADPSIIFDLSPQDRLHAAMKILGVSRVNLSEVAGHA